MSRPTLQLALALAAFFAVPSGSAQAAPRGHVYVGAYLHDVTNFDQRNGTYDVDAHVWVKWRGSFDPSRVRLHNEGGDVSRDDLGASSEGDWHSQRWRVRGTLRGEFPLHRFPFDEQTLPISFELPESDGELVPDLAGSGMASHFSVTGWTYEPAFRPRAERLAYASDLGTIEREGSASVVRRVSFEVTLHRPPVPITVKLFLPLLLNLLIAVLALFLAPEMVDTRSGIGVTVLLACFAFQYTVAGTIPDVAYLTIVDALFILAYAVTAIALVVTVLAYWLHRTDRHEQALLVDRWARRALPVLVFGATAVLLRPVKATPETVVASIRGERHPSARDTLRVGVVDLRAAHAFLVGRRAAWGLTHEEVGGRVAFLAEEAPAVTNDVMRFRADGRLELRYRLRAGVAWSDGRPLTTDDFRFALEVSPDPHLHSVETPDARTLVLVYDDVRANALDGFAPLPRHALGASFRRGGYDAVLSSLEALTTPVVGPYRMIVRDEARLVAEANPTFLGPAPAIRRVEVRRYATDDDVVDAFERGEIDVIGPDELSAEQADALAARRPRSVVEHECDDLVVLQPDLSVEWLADARARRALDLAIDRDAIRERVFGDGGRVAFTPKPGLVPNTASPWDGDIPAARALLTEAGALGKTLPLYFEPVPWARNLATRVTASLTAAGLVVEPHEIGDSARRYLAGDHRGLLIAYLSAPDSSTDPRRYLNVPSQRGAFATTARNAAYDDSLAELVDRLSRALYTERRDDLLERVYSTIPERVPIIPVAFAPRRFAVAASLRGADTPKYAPFGTSLEAWYFVAPTSAK